MTALQKTPIAVVLTCCAMLASVSGAIGYRIGCEVSAPPVVRSLTAPAQTSATIKRVVDGDTVVIDAQLVGDVWLKDAYMRLEGINAYELSDPKGPPAKAYAEAWLKANPDYTVKISPKRDKYGRLLGNVFSTDGVLTGRLLDEGHAVPYLQP